MFSIRHVQHDKRCWQAADNRLHNPHNHNNKNQSIMSLQIKKCTMQRTAKTLARLSPASVWPRRCLATATSTLMETKSATSPPPPPHLVAASNVMHRSLSHSPLLATRASGINIYTSAGQRIVDATSGAAVSCLGHSHPAIVEAIKKHLDGGNAVNYVATIMFTTSPAEELSSLLIESWEPRLDSAEVQSKGKVYFCAGGKFPET
jgi:4-aminobutyrate aminotransferase-like enzyme